ITTEIPLRRYQKDKPNTKLKGFFKIMGSIMALIIVILAIFLLERGLSQRTRKPTNASQVITVSTSVEETTLDGEKAYRVIFNTVNGKEINFLGDALEVENGRGEFIAKDTLLYSQNPQLMEDGMYEVNMDAIISAPGLPDSTERVNITLSPPYDYAPFTLLNPTSSEAQTSGSESKLSFKVEPNSQITINNEDFTSLLSENGRFERDFPLSDEQDELVLDIRITTPGCLDNIQQIIFRNSVMDVAISIDHESPIISNEEWIEVRGQVQPGASIEADQEVFEEPVIDQETGDFSIYIKASQPGYTPCILTAKLDGKESSIEVILEQKTTVDSYTSTAWKADFDELQRNEQLSNGRHFAFTGNIKDLIETGKKNVFTLCLDEDNNPDHIFYVEFWGTIDYESGDKVRVFANRWGNKDGLPRFLAKFIYD
ncbi:MAG TPA: hypothetical protein VFD57_00765, partial [Clostridia bacterium]|nr:hypothetical protein [Clostridia bacterium]